jgi:D-threo-aldose 1-dehydrogenase
LLPTRELQGTGIITSALGFGCAGLFWISERKGRRLVLDAAYDAGIRHFDVAPMYGLGLAETELASFLRRRRADVTITTKFGIDPSFLGRGFALLQRPLRALLAKKPGFKEGLKDAARGPHSGLFGRLLYSSSGYHLQSARLSMERSLRVLDTDWIDIFLLHDPTDSLIGNAPELVGYLNEQCRLGRIRSWGVTGKTFELPGIIRCLGQAPVIQLPDDIFEGSRPISADLMPKAASITYGSLARALPILRRFLTSTPGAADIWSERLGADLTEEANLPKMLLSIALQRNAAGPVLFTTTRVERTLQAAELTTPNIKIRDSRATAFSSLAAEVRLAYPEMFKVS